MKQSIKTIKSKTYVIEPQWSTIKRVFCEHNFTLWVMIIFLDFIILTQILFSFQKIGYDALITHLVDCNRYCNVTVISIV